MSKPKTHPDPPPPDTLPEVIPAPRRPPTLALSPDATVDQWHHNFDLATPQGKAALINASNVPEWQPGDGGSTIIDAVHYVCFPDEYADRETGEVVTCTALVLMDRAGRHVKFRNEWSLRRLHAMMALYGPDEWRAGIRIECYAAKSRRPGHTYGSFRVIAQTSNTETA